MNPRLRSMTLDGERSILVLDRMSAVFAQGGDLNGAKDMLDGFNSMAKSMGAAGGLVFAESVDLPNDNPRPEGLTIHADELVALRWAVDELAGFPSPDKPGRLTALQLLLQRAEQ